MGGVDWRAVSQKPKMIQFWGLKQLLKGLSVPLPFISSYIGFTLFALTILLMITDYTEIPVNYPF